MRILRAVFVLSLLIVLLPISVFGQDRKPGQKAVFLRNPATGKLKTRCLEVLGRHDAFPHFECYDSEGRLRPFEPGKDWEAVPLESACFRHKLRDTVKVCVSYQLKGEREPKYVCLDERAGKYVSFDVGTEWTLLKADEPVCLARRVGEDVPDVIRNFEFEIRMGGDEGEAETESSDSCQ